MAFSDTGRFRAPCGVAGDPKSIYQTAMGPAFAGLDDVVQRFHCQRGHLVLHGEVQTQAPATLVGRMLAWCLGTPQKSQNGAIRFELIAGAQQETWVRYFPSHRMSSRLSLRQGQLTEQLGAARLTFDLSEHEGSLNMRIRSLHVLGLRCPAWLLPQVSARESAGTAASDQAARLHFQVQAILPWVGRVAHYQGFLEFPCEACK
jgi:Domain of unknown function (DUF4166)